MGFRGKLMTITVLFAIGVYVHRALWTSTVNPLNLQFFFHELWIHILQLLIREFIKIVLSIHGIIIRYTAYWEGFKKKYWQIWFFFLTRLFTSIFSVCVCVCVSTPVSGESGSRRIHHWQSFGSDVMNFHE